MPPVPLTVAHMLRDAARLAPDAEALVCGADRLDYAAYWSAASGVADRLRGMGADGERVALLLGNAIPTAIACFGALASGAQLVPLNPLYTIPELRVILADAAPRIVVHEAALGDSIAPLCAELGISHCRSIEALMDGIGHGAPCELAMPEPAALALLQYTGGTSGRPKGVNLTHGAIATNVAQREALLPTEPDRERVLAVTPLYHSYASAMGLFLAAYCRGALVTLPRARPELVLEAIGRERITLFAGTPTLFTGLLAHPDFAAADLKRLRLCFSGSSALPEEVLRRWEKATGCPICEGFGQTEAGPVLTYNPRHGVRKIGSVGVALPLTEVEIVDIADGARVLPAGERGEIRARGPQIMRGYRNRPDETAEALREGWLYTGDIGEFDADGYLFVRDRKKEMVIVSGFNVYPREVEEVLFTHTAVHEAAVVGRPHPTRGEELVAFVVATEGAGDLRGFLAGRLARYKIPSDIRLVDVLPKTAVGKIDKQALKREART